MNAPTFDELVLLPEPLALHRHFDARNYRLFRWLLVLVTALSLGGIASSTSGHDAYGITLYAVNILLGAALFVIVGLHAHSGSGIRTPEAWSEVALFLAAAAERFPDTRVLDLGDLGEQLRRFKAANPRFELWLEPGRFLVAQAGVLLARVTQIKHKGDVTWVGLETGMNSLVRPPLYGAYHPIVNLSRLDEPATWNAHVVGPICETGDILGRSRRLPPTAEGDVLLIANAGAYGRVMSSWYNLREPAGEAVVG